MKIEVNRTSLLFLILMITIGGVVAYGGNNPPVMGHTSGEIHLNVANPARFGSPIPLSTFEAYLKQELKSNCRTLSAASGISAKPLVKSPDCRITESLTGGGCEISNTPPLAKDFAMLVGSKPVPGAFAGSSVWSCEARPADQSALFSFQISAYGICCS